MQNFPRYLPYHFSKTVLDFGPIRIFASGILILFLKIQADEPCYLAGSKMRKIGRQKQVQGISKLISSRINYLPHTKDSITHL